MTITNYIQERIELLRCISLENRAVTPIYDGIIDELQAVLSKIEELGK